MRWSAESRYVHADSVRYTFADTYAKQKKTGHLPDKTEFEAIKGMNGHPEVVKDYE